ncbi:hypothetical protein [Actinoplanes derwentensis]|uniref:Meckel syndrome type 1 protein n=1 Tax=Actinoplanes derwentensis TaxID=113562 RepID=A0A1H2CHZ3_9ACTN|nr:hypothetical protein [Actinoplanes derwentensis]GID88700.1 hypothetical protein Ade03nite_76240 [Actinoplanes derwentensis]SDT70031.1 hypothetical protein SAMN04489716_5872 [Actinoplanes derwentensis]
MRHLRSIFYALVLAPSIWVLIGVGFTNDLSSRGRDFFSAESISGLLLVIFAGILVTILAFSPISPAGPALTGTAFLGVTIWAWNSPAEYAALWAPEVAKEGFDLSRPGYGLAALLAVPLMTTALSARRWARYEPPVLPIIGEIGRFRGAAKAPGIPVAIEQTTVIRPATTGFPTNTSAPAADRTVAINSGTPAADRTVALGSGIPATDRTVALGSGVPAADRTIAFGSPAVKPTPPAAAPAARPTPAVKPAPAPAVKPAPAPAVVPTPAEDRTMALPSIDRATALTPPKPAPPKPAAQPVPPARPAQNLQQASAAQAVQQPTPKNLHQAGLAKSLQQSGLAQELKLSGSAQQAKPAQPKPAQPQAAPPKAAQSPGEQPTQLMQQVKPVQPGASEPTAPLRPGDPDATTMIPGQRQPPAIES